MKRKVTRNYQITLPKTIRESLDIQEGDYVEIKKKNGEIMIKKCSNHRETIELHEPLSINDIEDHIEEGMNQCGSSSTRMS